MSAYAFIRVLVLLLLLVPLASAVLVPVFGRAARRISLVIALVHLGMTVAVILAANTMLDYRIRETGSIRGDEVAQQFHPEFVPGDLAGRNNADGADGRTGWTLFRLAATEPAFNRPGPKIQLFLGIDGLNMWLVALASFMLIPTILLSWDSIQEKPGTFFGCLFLLQAGLIGTFLAFDVILFYVFFELTLIPSFFLIGRWGVSSGRRDAARKFFLYTLAGSLLTLLGVIGVVLTNPTPLHPLTGVRVTNAIVQDSGAAGRMRQIPGEWMMAKEGPITFSLPDLMLNVQVWANAEATSRIVVSNLEANLARPAPNATPEARLLERQQLESAKRVLAESQQLRAKNVETQFWLFIALMAGFMVKVPIWPFHTWLPGAYGEAPIGVTAFLSAVMAKLGTYGIMRLVLPLVPDAAITYGLPVVGSLAAFGIIYTAFCAYASKDIKLLIAYSSISHLGFLVLGLFAFNREGLTGGLLHMVNHGLTIGALFAALGFLLDRYRTTEMSKFGGLMGRFPTYAVLMFALCLASIGLPGLNNFVSEMLMLGGLVDADNPGVHGQWPAVIAVIGIFLSAWYTLTMLYRVFFNPPKEPEPVTAVAPSDVNRREFFALGSLVALCLLLGLCPQPVINTMKPDVRALANIGDAARARIRGVPFVSKEPPEQEQKYAPQGTAPEPTPQPKGKGGGPPGKGGKGKGKGGNLKGKGPNTKGDNIKGPMPEEE